MCFRLVLVHYTASLFVHEILLSKKNVILFLLLFYTQHPKHPKIKNTQPKNLNT